MTGFHDLPRELRHMILQYTFENDIIKDVRLNHHLYSRWLSFHRGHDGRYSDGYWGILVYIKREICSEVGYAQSCAPDNYPAPSLHQTIIKMIKAAPDLSDDTIFVGSLALSALEKAVNGLASESRESYFEDWEKLGGGTLWKGMWALDEDEEG